jgi:hypothetical protein
MKGECSQCKEPLTLENASRVVAKTGYGRCRSCENEHTKGRSRTLGGRYTYGLSQAKFNNHKWELSFQQYVAIVASGRVPHPPRAFCGEGGRPRTSTGYVYKMLRDFLPAALRFKLRILSPASFVGEVLK